MQKISWLHRGSEIMSVEKEQRDILFEACRHIATNKRTPEWIAGYLTQAVMKAKAAVNTDFPESLDAPAEVKQQPQVKREPLKVGDVVETKMFDKTTYQMTILADDGVCDGVQLWKCGNIQGIGARADIEGYEIPNVPDHWLKKV